jgi:hypothetical protein
VAEPIEERIAEFEDLDRLRQRARKLWQDGIEALLASGTIRSRAAETGRPGGRTPRETAGALPATMSRRR